MIQNFDVTGGPEFGRKNLPKLRKTMAKQMLDGFIIPHEDEYQNEYLPDCNERLMWVSGFTGSAGAAIVLKDEAAIFIDGRYTLQVGAQVDANLFSYERLEGNGPAKWLANSISQGQRIGYDPRLLTPSGLTAFIAVARKARAQLIAVDDSPLDAAWTDRPDAPLTHVQIMPMKYAGESHSDKRARIAKDLKDKKVEAAILTSPASIAWLLNIRGSDVMCTPLPLSTAVLHDNGKTDLYIHPDKITAETRAHLGNEISLRHEDNLEKGLSELAGRRVLVDPNSSSAWIFEQLTHALAKIISAQDPVMLPKAQKNSAEIAGTEAAHIRDGEALAKFLHWLDTDAQNGNYDEIQAAQKLESFRAEYEGLKDLSFESISGAQGNGAIVHYRVSTATNIKLSKGSLYLIDSGGQYIDGTTDVTRTIAIGTPSADMRRHYTLVLKGHIALAAIRFPKGTSGHALDVLARAALWNNGLDYDHGTGHGVGAYLGVHEGPQRISKGANSVALSPGMIVSNEPGFYKTGEYGIRIENLQYVHAPRSITGGEREMLGFTTLTFAPLDRKLIDTDLLSATEREWVNAYHADVLEKIGQRVEGDVKDWLKTACAPL